MLNLFATALTPFLDMDAACTSPDIPLLWPPLQRVCPIDRRYRVFRSDTPSPLNLVFCTFTAA